jgi:uncharacterized protein
MSQTRRIFVPDSSVIICLESIGHASLVGSLGFKAVVTRAVSDEIAHGGRHRRRLDATAVLADSEILENAEIPREVSTVALGAGEKSVIAACLKLGTAMAGLDDGKARTVAKNLGIPVIGTLGILLLAHEDGIIDNPVELAEELQKKGARISQSLFQAIRHSAGRKQ